MNLQSIEKQNLLSDGSLWVHSIFYTIQGEGPFAGTPAVFVRLAGCNLQCPGCDTEYTSQRSLWTVDEIVEHVNETLDGQGGEKPLVVITGGEPFRQNINLLVLELIKFGFFVQIETNGTLPTPFPCNKDIDQRRFAYIVCSPKTPKVHPSIEDNACAFKYVLSYDSMATDGLPVEVLNNHIPTKVYRPKQSVPIYLQPMDHTMSSPIGTRDWQNQKSLEAVKASCLKYGYILQLQIHKIIGVE